MKIRTIPVYFLLLATICLSGCSSSSTGNDIVDTTPPAAPSGLEIETIGNGAVSLKWNEVADKNLKGYYVYWQAGSPVDSLNAESIFIETYYTTISGLDYDILYYFCVSSVDQSNNESDISNQISGKPSNTTGPKPPSNVDLVAKNIGSPQINVFWAPNMEPDLDHYNIYRALSPSEVENPLSFFRSIKADSTSIIDRDVEINVKYYYKITAIDNGGWESAPSAVVSDCILPPVKPISPVEYEQVNKFPTFEWEKIDYAVGYHIFITTSEFGGEIWKKVVDENTTQITYNGSTELIAGNKYYWKIGAISRSEINSISAVGSFAVQN